MYCTWHAYLFVKLEDTSMGCKHTRASIASLSLVHGHGYTRACSSLVLCIFAEWAHCICFPQNILFCLVATKRSCLTTAAQCRNSYLTYGRTPLPFCCLLSSAALCSSTGSTSTHIAYNWLNTTTTRPSDCKNGTSTNGTQTTARHKSQQIIFRIKIHESRQSTIHGIHYKIWMMCIHQQLQTEEKFTLCWQHKT